AARPPAATPAHPDGAPWTAKKTAGTRADGSGLVFDPDPLTTAGVPYGGQYVDAGDADVDVLNAERIEVALRDITRGTDGLYRLIGPYATVDGSAAIGGRASTPPAEADPNGFRYGRADDAFEAVMVYYHIDSSQRYLQSLDVGRPIQAAGVRANPHGLGDADNSKYFASQNALAFGDGGIDDAEDADVIWHEYGHALLQGSAPGLLASREGQALHEGWADYWAASYSRHLAETNPAYDQNWRKVFSWDGNDTWNGRLVNREGVYPDDQTGNIYLDGLLWATTLMEIYDVVGRTVIDRLNLASHSYLASPVTFADAAEALIQADFDLYDGAHLAVLLDRLGAHGYVDPSTFGPAVAHTPVPYIEEIGSTVTFEIEAVPVAAPVETASIFYQVNGGAFEALPLVALGGDRFAADVVLPAEAAEVVYYVEVVDGAGQLTRLPAGAPEVTYRFGVGPDTAAPVITHEPIAVAAIQAWPARVVADVEDNQGVGTVEVDFEVFTPAGASQQSGTFFLRAEQGQRYVGAFPFAAESLEEGATIRYALRARDVSSNANEARFPETGAFTISIVTEGVLVLYNFETDQALAATGAWARGVPAYGVQVAHSGERVWATNLAGPYPAEPHRATLTLPALNLDGLDRAALVFWHWYDFEAAGTPMPGTPTAEPLWDGGNVKASTDGGATWTVLVPDGGYTGTLRPGSGNPMAGEPAFGGYSFGWRQVVVPLPTAADVRLRFDVGTDGSNEANSLFFAGWYLDDVRITTSVPADGAPPVLLEAPPAVLAVDAGGELPAIQIRAADDTGVEAVLVDYTVIDATGARTEGVERLPMSLADLTTFLGTLPTPALGPGSAVEYRLRLRDFAGNTTAVPEAGGTPFRIEYRLAERVGMLAGVRATGLWRRLGDSTYTIATGTAADPVSSLVLDPVDLPANADAIRLELTHVYQLGDGLGGNLQVSDDGGATWRPVAPTLGYPATLSGGPMDGQEVFAGQTGAPVRSIFDLSAFGGQQLRLRLDFGATRALAASEFWRIDGAELTFSTSDDGFDVPRELALHPNFPDPFSTTTTVSYTLPEAASVRLELYDLLGRRVALLADAEQEAGTHTVTLSAGTLASGVYLLRMMAGDTQKVERVVIAR
ncbi:MAG: T9SS type A sorting domain-containing protein, partial [Rhodothermales bacterium]|nr:T9SS type A sorting domain-containing protein [Rhodothermales bacterium]